MLSSDDPPRWVVLLDRIGVWHHCRTRVVIHEYATVDYEPSFDQPSITWMLEDVDYEYLTKLLRDVIPEAFCSANTAILDGDLCALTVVHGKPQWLAYAEVNLSSLPESERAAVACLAMKLTQIADSTANTE